MSLRCGCAFFLEKLAIIKCRLSLPESVARQERRNRNLQQWNQRHREFNEVWDETLYRRALRVPKTLDESMIEKERNELFYKAVARLPEIQRRRFLLYYEYDFNLYQIGEMEHCTASAVQKSVSVAREKVKAEMRKYLQP